MSKQLLVLARKDPAEAARVAAGLTIFGHEVSLVIMVPNAKDAKDANDSPDSQTGSLNEEQLELLELADIEPVTTVPDLAQQFMLIDTKSLSDGIRSADAVLSF